MVSKNRGLRIKTFMRELCSDEQLRKVVVELEKQANDFAREIEADRGIVVDINPYVNDKGAIRSIVVKYYK